MTIRPAEMTDVSFLVLLLSQLGYTATPEEMIKRMEEYRLPNYALRVAELENEVIGFAAMHWYHAFHHPAPIGRLVAFCIHQEKRNQQLGTKLLTFVEQYLSAQGCFKIELTSNLRRTESHQFYLHRGYQQSSLHLIKHLTLAAT